ncbi:hypothetical protein N431DRAFT_448762 [Stipitochalara longipes BDJ]|nr:hypothetical protein N431DRAFT_448762 [Stipitochalara longipes BDJ]
MYYVFVVAYEACRHYGQAEYRLCGISSCANVSTCGANDEMGGFCPECFLVDDFSQNLQRPWSYGVYLLMNSTSRNWLSSRKRAKEIYGHAARYHKDDSGSNDVLALLAPEGEILDATRMSIAQEMLEMLLRDFCVRIKYNIEPQPVLAERILIVQLSKLWEMEGINAKMAIHGRNVHIKILTSTVPEAQVNETDFCNICHEPFGTVDHDGKIEHCVKTNPCNHIFGNLCLASWFYTSGSLSCPMCRGELVPHARPEQPTAHEIATETHIKSSLKLCTIIKSCSK